MLRLLSRSAWRCAGSGSIRSLEARNRARPATATIALSAAVGDEGSAPVLVSARRLIIEAGAAERGTCPCLRRLSAAQQRSVAQWPRAAPPRLLQLQT